MWGEGQLRPGSLRAQVRINAQVVRRLTDPLPSLPPPALEDGKPCGERLGGGGGEKSTGPGGKGRAFQGSACGCSHHPLPRPCGCHCLVDLLEQGAGGGHPKVSYLTLHFRGPLCSQASLQWSPQAHVRAQAKSGHFSSLSLTAPSRLHFTGTRMGSSAGRQGREINGARRSQRAPEGTYAACAWRMGQGR